MHVINMLFQKIKNRLHYACVKISRTTIPTTPNAIEFSPKAEGITLTTLAASSIAHSLIALLRESNKIAPQSSMPPPRTTISGLRRFTRNAIFRPRFCPASSITRMASGSLSRDAFIISLMVILSKSLFLSKVREKITYEVAIISTLFPYF